MDEIHHPVTAGLVSPPTLLASTLGTARSGREAGLISSVSTDQNDELRPPNDTSPGTPGEVLEGSSLQEEDEEEEEEEEEESAHGHIHSPDPLPLPQEEPDREPNVMEPLSDHRGNRRNFLFIPDPCSDPHRWVCCENK